MMAGATFGRRGMEPSQLAGRRAQSGSAAIDDQIGRRRAAFIASERARTDQDSVQPNSNSSPPSCAPLVFFREKSLGTTYALWLILGGISAHRFYLGQPLTGIAQTIIWYVSLMLLMAGFDGALIPLVAGGLWLLADGLLIPGLRRAANDRLRERAESGSLVSPA